MTNEELLDKIIQDLDGKYQMGFHSISTTSYNYKKNWNKRYLLDSSQISNENIVKSILSNGLYVPESSCGLHSTVFFLNDMMPHDFNYFYWPFEDMINECYVILVAIPNYIEIYGRCYFIGDMTYRVNLANYSFFYSLLPKEFIYGYYKKQYIYKDENIKNSNVIAGCDDFVIEDNFDFYSNDLFYGYMSKEDQEQFWLNYFKDNKFDISVLDAVSYPNFFNTLFQSSRNKYAIKETRNQLLRRKIEYDGKNIDKSY